MPIKKPINNTELNDIVKAINPNVNKTHILYVPLIILSPIKTNAVTYNAYANVLIRNLTPIIYKIHL